MALPRRPYLLGLFPGTSNDWATQDRAKGESTEKRGGDGRLKKRTKRTHHKITCAQNKEFKQHGAEGAWKGSSQRDLIDKGIILRKYRESFYRAESRLGSNTGGHSGRGSATEVGRQEGSRHVGSFCPEGIQVCLVMHSEGGKRAKRVDNIQKESSFFRTTLSFQRWGSSSLNSKCYL